MDDLGNLAKQARADQAMAAMVDLARALGAYHTALLDSGFEDDEAFELVVQWQAIYLVNSIQRKDAE